MATGGDWTLDDSTIAQLAPHISSNDMATIAQSNMMISAVTIKNLRDDTKGNAVAFNREVLLTWRNKYSGPNQQLDLAVILYKAADEHGNVDPLKIESILGITKQEAQGESGKANSEEVTEEDVVKLAENLRPLTEQKTKIQGLPWAKKDVMKLEDIYTDVTLEKIEQKPTGTVRTPLHSYAEIFGKTVGNGAESVVRTKKTAPRSRHKSKGKQKLKVKSAVKSPEQQKVIQPGIEGKRILFKADPGMGKTSLMNKVTYDWVKGIFTVFTIVFFVSLKLVRPGDPIENIIIQQNPKLEGLNVSPQKLRAILESFGHHCLLILDGFDENDSNKDEILKILRGEKLLACSVMVTSRPHTEGDISDLFQIVCEVSGFQNGRASSFISRRLKDKTKTTAVLNFYRRNFGKSGLEQFSPLILLFVCALVDADNINLSANNVVLGEIYFRTVRRIYLTYLKRKVVESYNESKFVDVVKKMGKLAWQTLIEGRKFRQKADIMLEIDEKVFNYGYLTGHEDDRLQADETADIFVTFVYRTIEEFFLSYHFVGKLVEGNSVEKIFPTDCKKPIFTTNMLFLHFSLWFLYSGTVKQYLPVENNQMGQKMLVLDVSNRIDASNLDFSCIAGVYPALRLQRVSNGDTLLERFWKRIISECHKVRQLMLAHDDPFELILDSLQGILGNVFLLQLLGSRYNSSGFSMDAKLVRKVNPRNLNLVLSLKEARFLDVISPYFVRINKLISLHVIVTGMESLVNVTEFMKPGVGRIHVVCDNFNTCRVVVKRITKACPNLTHLLIRGMALNSSVTRNLCQAVKSGKLPHLSHLDIEHTLFTLQRNLGLLFASVWPQLTHLGLAGSFLDRSDVEVLLQHDHLLPKLASLHLFLGCGSDIVEREQLEGLFPKYIPIQRKIDIPLFSLFRVQWPSLRKLWLHDMNKNEYNHIVALFNAGSLPNLTELGISMWSLAKKQRSPQIQIQIKLPLGSSGRSVTHQQKLELITPVIVKTLTHLTLHQVITSVQHLDTQAGSIVGMQLEKLDISHSTGITGHLSNLFKHRLPSIKDLILSNCELNSDDLRSLAKANVEGKLPELRHLDISQNEELNAGYETFFAEGADWNKLLQLNCDQPSVISDEGLEEIVNPAFFKSLQKLTVSVAEGKILRENAADCWSSLSELEVRTPFMSFMKPLRNIVAAFDIGFLRNLEKVRFTLACPEINSKEREAFREEILSLHKELNKRFPQEITNQVIGSLLNLLIHIQSNTKFVIDNELTGKPMTEIVQSNFEAMVSSMIDTLSEPVNAEQRKFLRRHLGQFWANCFGNYVNDEVTATVSFLEEVLIDLATLKQDLQRRNVSVFLHLATPPLDTDSLLKSIENSLPPVGQHNKK